MNLVEKWLSFFCLGKTIQSDSNINELEKSIKQLNVEQNTSDADCVDEENEDEEDEEEEVEEEEEEEDDEEYEDEDDEYEPVFDAKATLSYMEDGKWKVSVILFINHIGLGFHTKSLFRS